MSDGRCAHSFGRAAGVHRFVAGASAVALIALVAATPILASTAPAQPVVRLVSDINQEPGGPLGSSPGPMASVGTVTYFAATTQQQGTELWRSDGTAGGTVLVKDIVPGVGTSSPENLVVAGGVLYFTADDGASVRELWRSNGTAGGTFLVKGILPGPAGSEPGLFSGLVVAAASSSSMPRTARTGQSCGGAMAPRWVPFW